MKRLAFTALAAGVTLVSISCSGATQSAASPAPGPVLAGGSNLSPADLARAEANRFPFTQADVHFMSGMIGHHAQAVLMAGWAPSHGASLPVRLLCERIVVGQRDEIVLMQTWLRERNQTVPSAEPYRGMARMAGMEGMDERSMLMPGMLTGAQLADLDAARGADFDRKFLTYMIVHHQGALTMVEELFNSTGAAQDDVVFKFATDVHADQSTEIARMTLMLADVPAGGRAP